MGQLTPEIRNYPEGCLLLIDKPQTWTSFDVVNKIRYALKRYLNIKKIKVGHSGTLDPMATGLLIICTGKWTKKLGELQGLDKEYQGTMVLGATTPSYDAETPVDHTFSIDHLDESILTSTAEFFKGRQDQIPPMYSAIKVDGQPLYKLARKGKTLKIKSREVNIESFKLIRIELPEVDFQVTCSKGTYIRSLVHDFGKKLDCGAYLNALRRTRIGDYSLENAETLDEFLKNLEND